jgi:hypothetical protein
MNIREISPLCRRDVKKFIDLPFGLYGGSEQWVPPMISDMEAVFHRNVHPFYQHSTAAFFIAEEGGEFLGRIAVMNNRKYNETHGTRTALFYFFDAYPDDDEGIVPGLFGAAMAWARQQGLTQIVGPLGFHALDGRGILVEGFDFLPATGIPYNYEYYGQLIEKEGFRKKSDFLSGVIKYQSLPARLEEVRQRRESSFQVKSFSSKKELIGSAEALRQIYNETFTTLFDHYKMSQEEMAFVVKRLIDVADARLIKAIVKDGKSVGFVLVYPNIVKGIKKAQGRLWPLGWFYLLRELKRTKRVDFNGVAILPEFQGLGGSALLYAELQKSLDEFGFCEGEIVQIEEDNKKSLGEVGLFGVDWRKKHRVYVKDL